MEGNQVRGLDRRITANGTEIQAFKCMVILMHNFVFSHCQIKIAQPRLQSGNNIYECDIFLFY